jgi:hypothetical protein
VLRSPKIIPPIKIRIVYLKNIIKILILENLIKGTTDKKL